MGRFVALIFAYIFLALAIVGMFLPGLPTVPFLLLTAWFAAKGSEKLHRWLYAHPHLGKLLIDWEQRKAISRKTKVIALVMLVVSWIIMYFRIQNMVALVSLAVLFVVVGTYIATRPE